jgi:Cu+-exporting ATPase
MDEERRERIRYYVFAAFVGVLLFLNWAGIFTQIFGIDTAILITLLAGYKTFHNSISALLEHRISADIALCIAVIAAFAIGQYIAAAEAMFIVLVGEGLESYAAGRTEAAIQRFVAQMPALAHVLREGREETIDASSVVPGDLILVRAGERVPADGTVELGLSTVDESSITGEPLPHEKQPGDEIFSGSLNGAGLLHVRVARAGSDTTLARVVALVREAQDRRAPVERLADRAAKYFLPALLLAAAFTFLFTRDWMRTVSVLIVACPCALILATPTAMIAAIGGLARRGILVRGADVLQRAAAIDTVVFDKTGTITEGVFEIVDILALDRSPDDLLALAAAAEKASGHPLARIIVEEAERRRLSLPFSDSPRIVAGRGVESKVDGHVIRAGNGAFLQEAGVDATAILEHADRIGATPVLIASGQELAGAILLRDRLREGVAEAVEGLAALCVQHTRILTGDRRRAAEALARQAGIGEVEAGLTPEAKAECIAALRRENRAVAMIGDGVNDAPALAGATVGIAVDGAADIAAEAAGVVYMPHSLAGIPVFFEASRRAVATAWQNIILFAGLVNLAAVLCAASGIVGPIGAAVTHQLSSFLVMLNSLRLLYVGTKRRIPRLPEGWREALEYRARTLGSAAIDNVRRQPREWARRAVAAAVVLILLNGIYIIRPTEIGIVQRFGQKLLPYDAPGPHYKLPWPIDRLTRVRAHQVRTIEIGYRSNSAARGGEPASYEWNAQHRSGRYQSRPDESLTLTGDQNLVELNATVHYDLSHPDDFLLHQADGEATVRAAAEAVLRSALSTMPLGDVLTTGRAAIEQRVRGELQSRLDRYHCGVRVLSVRLEDVHPSVEVVDAFRDVSAAYEEKNRRINEAEGYRNEQVALARGNAQALVQQARAYTLGRDNRAQGDAARFIDRETAYRTAPGPTETRLYLETLEQVLPGKRKLIVDRSKSPRRLFLLEDSIEIGTAPNSPLFSPAPQRIPEQ